MKLSIVCLAFIVCFLSSCSDRKTVTGKDLMPEMLQTDSLQVIYFKSPDTPRYFKYTSVSDPAFISALVKDVTEEIQPENRCAKEGKIYCYKKGEVFNTIFFAHVGNECTVLRYIKNGNLYNFRMSNEVRKGLHEYKSIAIEPLATP